MEVYKKKFALKPPLWSQSQFEWTSRTASGLPMVVKQRGLVWYWSVGKNSPMLCQTPEIGKQKCEEIYVRDLCRFLFEVK